MNMRTKKKIYEYGGFKGDLTEFATHFGINRGTLNSRLASGWSIERAITTPVDKRFAVKFPTQLTIGNFRGSALDVSNWFGFDLGMKERTNSELAVQRIQKYHDPHFYVVNFADRSYKGTLTAIADDFGCPLTELYVGIKAGKQVDEILKEGGYF